MSLSELTASELAHIDAVCLDFESAWRRGDTPNLELLVERYTGDHVELLRRELELVRQELVATHTEQQHSDAKTPSTQTTYFEPAELPGADAEIGPYTITKRLGRGGMGVVFEAIDRRLDRKVAIKMLAVEIAKRRDLTDRFDREARAVAAISHPNIVELFDVGSFDGLPYAVMEYLDGELLSDRMQRGRFESQEVRRMGAQIADALDTAHRANVIHRDLKPHNIMLVPRSGGDLHAASVRNVELGSTIVKLFDFGLSRAPRSGWGSATDETQEGVVLGTPGYMAPEQALGEPVTYAADIFSLGCILYEAFYGERAFDGATKIRIHQATLNENPKPDPIRQRADIELAGLIEACLRKDPSGRPESAAAIATQLRSGGSEWDFNSGSVNPPGSRRRLLRRRRLRRRLLRRTVVATAIVGILLAGGGVYWLNRPSVGLTDVRSIGVLSFREGVDQALSDATYQAPPPIGDAEMSQGDLLGATLVHELSRIPGIRVPPFRQLQATTRQEYRRVASELNVDALVTGDIRRVDSADTSALELNVHIVSGIDGSLLWSREFRDETARNLLDQSRLASVVASAINQRLVATADGQNRPSDQAFACLIDAKTRSDPDSVQGLKMALACFQDAYYADQSFADPIAGIALTSITLAAQSDTTRAIELIQDAREKSQHALQIDANSIDARLAVAMLNWQTVKRFAAADREFRILVMEAPNNWQVRHQYGLFQLAVGRAEEALNSLREASQLNPLSVSIKVDIARTYWYIGDTERAILDATYIRNKYDNSALARGLLIDIHEHQGRLEDAAAQDASFPNSKFADAAEYLEQRASRLVALPYGPFGDAINLAIHRSRATGPIGDESLFDLIDQGPPMLRLILAVHPSFSAARNTARAQEELPASI